MAVPAYSRWLHAGKPLQAARPVRDIVDRLDIAFRRAADVRLFSWYANDAHYEAVPAEDHTPYSQTGWPVPSPQWWVFAVDVMHRPDLGVDCNVLFAYWISEARAGRMPWLKYLNWQGRQYRAKGYGGETVAFRTAWLNSGHFDHIHISVRTDFRDTGLGSWSLTPGAPAAPAGGDDMDRNQNAKLDGVFNLSATVELDTGKGLVAFPVPLTVGVKALGAKLDAIGVKVDAALSAIGAIGTNSPEVAGILAGLDERLASTRTALEAEVRDAVADLGEGGAKQVRDNPPA